MAATVPPEEGSEDLTAESLDWMADYNDAEGEPVPGGRRTRARPRHPRGQTAAGQAGPTEPEDGDESSEGRRVLWRAQEDEERGARKPTTDQPTAAAVKAPPRPAGGNSRTRPAVPPQASAPAPASQASPTASSGPPAGSPPNAPAPAQPSPGGAAPSNGGPEAYRVMPSVSPPQPSNFAMGLGRAAPAPATTDVPVAAPSAQPSGVPLGLGREVPQSAPAAPVQVSQPTAGEEAYKRASTEAKTEEGDISLPEVLDVVINLKASDLHLTAGSKPTVRVNGSLKRLEDFPLLDAGMIQRTMYGAITQTQRERFEETLELDFSYSLPGRGRFRVNIYRQKDSLGAAFRLIPYEIKSLEALGIPASIRDFANLPRGFVLVTGPTGSGKSTTLASLIDHANTTRKDHIMTVEDPIEFLHQHKSCLVNQREVGTDTTSFNNALKHVLRQDPDIILVGEMRDLETISVALTAAETGHLVFATLHTQDAAQTIDRVIDVFPPHQQQQVRQQLAGALQGVVCQTLCKTFDGRGRVVATEILIVTPAVRNLIREGKTHQVYSAMQAGAKHGMHTMDQHLAQLVRSGKISYETGLEKCHHLVDYNKLCGRG